MEGPRRSSRHTVLQSYTVRLVLPRHLGNPPETKMRLTLNFGNLEVGSRVVGVRSTPIKFEFDYL